MSGGRLPGGPATEVLRTRSSNLQHLGFCAPVSGQDLAPLMGMPASELPRGYEGAPVMTALIQGLLETGLRLSVFTLSRDLPLEHGARSVQSRRWPGLQVHFVPLRRRAWQPVQGRPGRILDLYRAERAGLAATIAGAAPQLVHAHWAYEFAWAALDSGLPTVVTSHDAPLSVARMNTWAKPTISLYRWLRVLMARQVLRRARHVTAVSPHLAQALHGMVTQPVTVVPNPVDGALVARGRDRQCAPEARLALISNGWNGIKNARPALLAFARLQAEAPGMTLHVFGHDFQPGGPADAWCRGQAAMRQAWPAIRFHGPLPHADLMRALEGVDLLLHASLEESFGMVLVEAMALGLPVLAGARSGAVPWVVQDPRCLCDVTDPQAMARAAAGLLQAPVYAQLSRQLRAMVAERFSMGEVLSRYERAYLAALADADPPQRPRLPPQARGGRA